MQISKPGEEPLLTNAEFAEILDQFVSYQEMLDLSAGLYRKYFTDEEIKQITIFYASPLGQKFIRNQPQIVADTQGFMQAKISDPAFMKLIEKTVAEKLQKSAKRQRKE